MELLSNAFSVLDLDADDDRLNTSVASSATSSNSNNKAGKTDNGVKTEGKLKSQDSSSAVASSSAVYKMPLVWIDLEMTGLNVEVDRILEIACIITDGNLTKSVEGPDLVIHQSKECLEKMGEWCQTHHTASGLTNKVLQSKVSETEAEKQVIEFVKRHVGSYTPLLAGNSVNTCQIWLISSLMLLLMLVVSMLCACAGFPEIRRKLL